MSLVGDGLSKGFREYPSVWGIIAANLFILLFVLSFGLTVFEILLLYWFESAIIGFFTVVKMITADWDLSSKNGGVMFALKFFLIPFFMVHYGMFMLGHLLFIFAVSFSFGPLQSPDFFAELVRTLSQIILPALALFASHGYSFVHNFLKSKEYQTASMPMLMFSPYPRIVLMHVVLICGSLLSMVTMMFIGARYAQLGVICLFILAKIFFDIGAHIKERMRYNAPSTPGFFSVLGKNKTN